MPVRAVIVLCALLQAILPAMGEVAENPLKVTLSYLSDMFDFKGANSYIPVDN